MDTKKLIIRNVIRIIGIIAGVGTVIAAFVFRTLVTDFDLMVTACVASRICAAAMFVLAAAFMVFDIVTRAYPISISVIGVVIAAIAFIGSFIIAPASSKAELLKYTLEHMKSLHEVDTTQLEIGSYMVLAGGLFFVSYNAGNMKKGR